MDKKVVSLSLGIIGVFLWFMPFIKVEMSSFVSYQSGKHIGGIANLLVVASLAYLILSVLELHAPRVVAAVVASAICAQLILQVGSWAGWGLIAHTVVSLIGVYLSVEDYSSIKKSPVSQK
ncbi:hypothetical protein [Vibrio japonicus]|uniref:Uncharacterized protein n=1 Tax=Vibrio japonicus TaxID=1824638 RepID=A0ABY5LJG5_9VIBR|nr:hypothetical protein [Vibrio japonicus]UUM32189.1 hypothetical protein NP165_18020 [Vibrio japonicus]